MNKLFLTLLAGASFLVAGAAQALPTLDIKQFSNNAAGEYFTPAGSETSSPYYRDQSEDWDWTHGAVAGASGASSITLNISAFDVDEAPCSATLPDPECEVDNIEAWDAGTASWILLGKLAGDNNVFSFTNFVLGASLYDDVEAGLQVRMDIDANDTGRWLVSLAKSVISVDGATLPNPNPTPEPAILALLGLGLAGIGFVRRRKA